MSTPQVGCAAMSTLGDWRIHADTNELRRGEPKIEVGDISSSGGRLSFLVRDPTQLDAAVERLRTLTQPVGLTGTRDWDVSVVDSTRIVLTPTQSGSVKALKDAMTVARDVVRRRIDPQGTKEITVINQGDKRILVQVPGVEDPEALKALIGQTARLEFKLVDLEADPALVAQGRAPAGSQVLPMVEGGAIAVKRRVMVSGDQLVDARQSFDQDGRPVVSIKFNTAGARRFGRVTQENVGKPFAIILDDKVLSAPNINEPILGGQAQISGSYTVASAGQLAVALPSDRLAPPLGLHAPPGGGLQEAGRALPADEVEVLGLRDLAHGQGGRGGAGRSHGPEVTGWHPLPNRPIPCPSGGGGISAPGGPSCGFVSVTRVQAASPGPTSRPRAGRGSAR